MAGTNPIEKGPNQVANAQIDLFDIGQRREAVKLGVSLFGGLLEDRHLNILPAELVFEYRRQPPIRANRTSEPLTVFSTFNGAFHKTDTMLDIIAKLHHLGLSVKSSLFDETDANTDVTQVVMLSGLRTILVNSKERIPQGSWLIWLPPDPTCPNGAFPRDADRYLPLIKAYDPELDRLTKCCMMKYSRGEYTDNEAVCRSPLAEGTREFFRAAYEIGMLFLHGLFRMGILQFNDQLQARLMNDDATQTLRNRAASSYNRSGDSVKRFFIELSNTLDLLGHKPSNLKTTVPLPRSNQTKEMEFRHTIREILFGEDEDLLIVGYEPGTNFVPSGNEGMVLNNQRDVVDSISNAIIKTNEFSTSRIFGKALSPGIPGGKMDIQLAQALTIKYC